MNIEEYKQTIKKLNGLNKVIESRLSGMLEVQNKRSLKMNSGLRHGDFLPKFIGNLWGNVDFDALEDGKVWITYCGHCRGEGFTDDFKLPLECFTAETDEQAFDAYVNSFQKKYAEEDKKEAARKKASEKAAEKREKALYERLKEKYEGKKKDEQTAVYECAHFEYEYDDLGKYRWCRNEKSGTNWCDCKYIYAQQFCPFYKKGKLRGKCLIGDAEIEDAKMFKEEWSKHGAETNN